MKQSIEVVFKINGDGYTYERVAYTPKARRTMRAFLLARQNRIYPLNTKDNSVAYGFFANKSDPDIKKGDWNWGGFIDDMRSVGVLWDYIVLLDTGRLYRFVKPNAIPTEDLPECRAMGGI